VPFGMAYAMRRWIDDLSLRARIALLFLVFVTAMVAMAELASSRLAAALSFARQKGQRCLVRLGDIIYWIAAVSAVSLARSGNLGLLRRSRPTERGYVCAVFSTQHIAARPIHR
jgi:hypothetical protein